MNQMEPAVLKKNLDMKFMGMASETEGPVSENHNMNLAIQNLDMTLAIQNHNVTADMAIVDYQK